MIKAIHGWQVASFIQKLSILGLVGFLFGELITDTTTALLVSAGFYCVSTYARVWLATWVPTKIAFHPETTEQLEEILQKAGIARFAGIDYEDTYDADHYYKFDFIHHTFEETEEKPEGVIDDYEIFKTAFKINDQNH